MKVFSGRSNKPLTAEIVKHLGIEMGKISFRQFADGELWVKYEENIRGQDVFVVQSTQPPAENILELVFMIDAAVRASADRVTAVIPYYGYARQDRKDQPRVPISARVIMDMLSSVGAGRVLTIHRKFRGLLISRSITFMPGSLFLKDCVSLTFIPIRRSFWRQMWDGHPWHRLMLSA